MATIYQRNNKGKITYGVQIKFRDSLGKEHYKCTTFDNPQNLTGVRLKNALQTFALQWEQKIKSGDPHDLADATFKQVAEVWFDTRKGTLSDNYKVNAKEIIDKLDKMFGNIKFVDIKAYEVQQVFIKLNNYEFENVCAVVKPDKREKLNEIAYDYGVKKACREGNFSRPTLYYARKGEHITVDSAKNICKMFGLVFDKYFDKQVERKHYRKESIMKYKRVLSSIYTYAMSIELVSVNYASSHYLKGVIGGEQAKEIEILDDNEFNALLTVLGQYDIFDTIPMYLGVMLGLRSCEICGLQWRDIDFEKRVIHITRNRVYIKGKGVIEKELKTKYSKRNLPICNALYDILTKFKDKYDLLSKNDKHFDRSGYLFCNVDGTPKFPHTLNHTLKRFLTIAGCKQISCHKLRHTWITRMIQSGVPVNIVSRLAGHANSDITFKIYTHYCQDMDASVEVMEKLFSKSVIN